MSGLFRDKGTEKDVKEGNNKVGNDSEGFVRNVYSNKV